MSNQDRLREAEDGLQDVAKNILVAAVGLKKVQASVRSERAGSDIRATGAWSKLSENPKRLHIMIEDPVPTLNLDMKGYMPKDRFVWSTLREWWRGQIAWAVAPVGKAVCLESPVVLVQTTAACDLDNLGVKSILDALQYSKVVENDGAVRFLALEHTNGVGARIDVYIIEASEEVKQAISSIHRLVSVDQDVLPEGPSSANKPDFFSC